MSLIWLAAAAGFVAGIAALPWLREALRRPASHQDVPGQRIALRHGTTHIRQEGPSHGPVVVLVHGLTTPSFVFEGLIPGLVARGHRVITYDHYGRGGSDRPRLRQTAEVFRSHLTEVLQACQVNGPVTLVGYSMGGAVVTDYAAHHLDHVRRVVLLAPAGLHALAGQGLFRLIRVPGLGTWLFHMIYPRLLRHGIAAERALPSTVPEITTRQRAETQLRGFFPAVLSSLRGLLAVPLHGAHRHLAQSAVPVTAIFGADDAVIPTTAQECLGQWNPGAEIHILPGAGHGLPYTHTDAVLALLPQDM